MANMVKRLETSARVLTCSLHLRCHFPSVLQAAASYFFFVVYVVFLLHVNKRAMR